LRKTTTIHEPARLGYRHSVTSPGGTHHCPQECGRAPSQDIAISVISVEEQLSGWYTLLRQAKQDDKVAFAYLQLARSVRSLSTLTILDYDFPCIHRYDTLRKLKLNVRKMDLRISAVVLQRNATLVTRNAQDFKQVPGLTFVDWSQ
jgi:tRNA(fMet)-specific endonuclease VapC